MSTISDTFKTSTGKGQARPLWADELRPTFLDGSEATAAREAWEAANAKGAELYASRQKLAKEWGAAHPERDYVDRAEWAHARDLALREADAAVRSAEKAAERALRAYHEAQRTSSANVDATAVAEEADARARELLAELVETVNRRTLAAASSPVYVPNGHDGRLSNGRGLRHVFDDLRVIVEQGLERRDARGITSSVELV